MNKIIQMNSKMHDMRSGVHVDLCKKVGQIWGLWNKLSRWNQMVGDMYDVSNQ